MGKNDKEIEAKAKELDGRAKKVFDGMESGEVDLKKGGKEILGIVGEALRENHRLGGESPW